MSKLGGKPLQPHRKKNPAVSIVFRPTMNLKLTRRIHFWSAVRRYASERWLESYGWTKTRSSWLLPTWHPKYHKDRELHGRGDLSGYDLKHACNSQEAHGAIRDEKAMLPLGIKQATPFPSYVTWRPFQLCVLTVANLFAVAALTSHTAWVVSLLMLLAVAFLGLGTFIGWKTKRDCELDWAEERLNKGTSHEEHDPD